MPRRASRTGKGSKSSKTARVLGLLTNPGTVEEEGASAAMQEQADDAEDQTAQAEIRSALEQELLGLLPDEGAADGPAESGGASAPQEDAETLGTARSAYDALLSAEDDDWGDAPSAYEEGRGRGSRHRRKQKENVPAPEADFAAPDEYGSAREPSAPDEYGSAREPSAPDEYGSAREPSAPDVYGSAPEPSTPDVYESAPEPSPPDVYGSAREPSLPDVYESAPEPGEHSAISKRNLFASAPKPVPAPTEPEHQVHDWNPPRAEDRENLVLGHPEQWICFNLTQALVEEKTDKYMRLFGMCTCPRCKVDVTAIALMNLPVKYVATQNREVVPLLSMYETKYSAEVISQVISACKKVMTRPHHGRS